MSSDEEIYTEEKPVVLGEHGEILSDHRGAFGEFGATVEEGFLDRSFRERVVIVGLCQSAQTDEQTSASLDELELLIDTAGASVVERFTQRRDRPHAATFVGKGKVQEILDACLAHDVDTVIFDDELSPGQQLNLEQLLKRTALDRTAVILDIFAQHATSSEGKAQVELAQLKYRLPRLKGKTNFSQQGGGIGTRGPGETQLEVDRRRLVRKVHKLEKDLKTISNHRENQRKARTRSHLKKVSLVGYTNAGKSSLLRRLTGADVLVEDKLFATVDPTTRKLALPGGEQILLSDTVGFVKKLPHQLVEAFQSTLEVSASADLLLHVVDISSNDVAGNIEAVQHVLAEIEAEEVPTLLVCNKADATDEAYVRAQQYGDAIAVSAVTGEGIDELIAAISDSLQAATKLYDLFVPWDKGEVLALLHREAHLLSEESQDNGMKVQARLEEHTAKRLASFIK